MVGRVTLQQRSGFGIIINFVRSGWEKIHKLEEHILKLELFVFILKIELFVIVIVYEDKELKLEDVETASHTVSGRGECERVKRRGSVDPNAVPANLVPFNWMPFGRYTVPIQWNW